MLNNMVIDNSYLSFEQEFVKRFTNYCYKAPLRLEFYFHPSKITITNLETNETKIFIPQYNKSVKENIFEIHQFVLYNWSPILVESIEKFIEPSIKEIQEMINSGIQEDKALLIKYKQVTTKKFILSKVFITKDQMFLLDPETNECYAYLATEMPSSLLLRNIWKFQTSSTGGQEESYKLFFSKSKLLYKIEKKVE